MTSPPLPRLILIVDGFASGRASQTAEEVQDHVCTLVEAGLAFVQLRDHQASVEPFAAEARDLANRLRDIRADVLLVVNSRPKVAFDLNAGLHVGRTAATTIPHTPLQGERGGLFGCSAHTVEDLQQASAASLDYATFSPIFQTTTHPELKPLGLETLSDACAAVARFPVFALGGITPERATACLGGGAYGVAVLSDLLDAVDPAKRLMSYREAGAL